MPSKTELQMLQALPLEIKVAKTQQRTWEWVRHYGVDGVYISFSGGLDSTVLLDITREMYPSIPAVFIDTGLEFPEIREFALSKPNVERRRPERSYYDVVRNEGYPIISKIVSQYVWQARNSPEKTKRLRLQGIKGDGTPAHSKSILPKKYHALLDVPFEISPACCYWNKEKPLDKYARETNRVPITAQMADEGQNRESAWLRNGCNAFDRSSGPMSNPMSPWIKQDVLRYIRDRNLEYCSVYGEIQYAIEPNMMRLEEFAGCSVVPDSEKLCCSCYNRTGCIYCAMGAHMEKDNRRFIRLKETHPDKYEYCMGGGGWDGKLWKPNKAGLGMAYVLDTLNGIYGKGFIPYE